jgi:hypothetical protein
MGRGARLWFREEIIDSRGVADRSDGSGAAGQLSSRIRMVLQFSRKSRSHQRRIAVNIARLTDLVRRSD